MWLKEISRRVLPPIAIDVGRLLMKSRTFQLPPRHVLDSHTGSFF